MLALKNSSYGTDESGKFLTTDMLEYQFGEKRMDKAKAATKSLIEKDLIERFDDDEDVFRLTPYGQMEVSNNNFSVNNFSNISNSNIANHSQNVEQSINISEQPQDIQDKVREFEQAAHNKDSSGMKKAFGYIADKAVDVAIAIAMRNLM